MQNVNHLHNLFISVYSLSTISCVNQKKSLEFINLILHNYHNQIKDLMSHTSYDNLNYRLHTEIFVFVKHF